MTTAEQLDEGAEEMQELARIKRQQDEVNNKLKEKGVNLKPLEKTISDYVMSDYEAVTMLSKNLNINATEARKQLSTFPNEYVVDGENIPDLVKKMRKARRQLKGDDRLRMAKAIDTIIDGYSDHITKCIDSIYWLKPYKEPLLKMRFNEKDLIKINKIDNVKSRRKVVDSL